MDVRDTGITDSDLQCFNVVHSLRELLLECPANKRAHAAAVNDNESDHRYKTPNDAIPDAKGNDLDNSSDNDNDDGDDDSDDDSPERPNDRIATASNESNGNANIANLEVTPLQRREYNGFVCYVGTMNDGSTAALLNSSDTGSAPQQSNSRQSDASAGTSSSPQAGPSTSTQPSQQQQQPSTSDNPPPAVRLVPNANPPQQHIIIIQARPTVK